MHGLIEKIEEYAAALMSVDEVATMLNMDIEQFRHQLKYNPGHEWSKAFNKGRLQTKLDLRKKVIALAKAGSPQAEVLADKYIKEGI